MSFKKYPKYKPSGIEWIGEIPGEWVLKRLKYEVGYQKGKNPKELSFDEKGKPYLTMEYLRNRPKQIFFVEDYENYISVSENEILLLWDGSNAGEFIRSKEGILSSTMALLKIYNQNINYAWYFFRAFENQLREATVGMGVPHVNGEEFRNQYFVIPPKSEQTAIANYLDDKTAKIDSLIEKKKKLIELYKEERTAIINQAVTRGINPGVKLKESGIDWLGQIPEHWEVKKLKYVSKIISKGTTPSTIGGRLIDAGNIRFIKAENILPTNEISLEPEFFIDDETNQLLKRSELEEYDILIVIAGATIGKVGLLYKEFLPANTNQAVCFIRMNELQYAKWLLFFLQSYYIRQHIQLASVQAAQPNLSMENIGNFQILFPTYEEIPKIIEYIETETKRIDEKIAKTEKQIELLQEYRTALINEIVTGKIKVNDD